MAQPKRQNAKSPLSFTSVAAADDAAVRNRAALRAALAAAAARHSALRAADAARSSFTLRCDGGGEREHRKHGARTNGEHINTLGL